MGKLGIAPSPERDDLAVQEVVACHEGTIEVGNQAQRFIVLRVQEAAELELADVAESPRVWQQPDFIIPC